MGTSTLDLIIADDHPVFRAGMLSIVRSALGDVRLREAGSASALKRELATAPADLLVLDVFFPGLEPESDLKEIRAAYPLMAVLVVSMLTERGAVERLMRAGANGFVSKRSPPEFMLKGIREVMEGERRPRPAFSGRRQSRPRASAPAKRCPETHMPGSFQQGNRKGNGPVRLHRAGACFRSLPETRCHQPDGGGHLRHQSRCSGLNPRG